jgi:hypothetical protein
MSGAEHTVAIKLALYIGERWGLAASDLGVLLTVPVDQVERWKQALGKRGAIDQLVAAEVLVRIRLLVEIQEALHTLFPDAERADGWIHRPNAGPRFDGRSALTHMLTGRLEDLQYVRDYVLGWTQ